MSRRFFVLVLAIFATACSESQAQQGVPPGAGVTVVFSDKPVALPTLSLKDVNGNVIDPALWKGKTLLVNFWATWCGPCRAEIPDLIALQDKYRDQLVVLGLSVDEGPVDAVKAWAEANHVNYPVAVVDASVEHLFGGVRSVPSTFVVSPKGGIVQRHIGTLRPEVTEQEVRALSNLPTAAAIQVVPDTGQVLKANAAYATEIPGVDLAGLTPEQKALALKRLNEDLCTCGCGSTLAQCRIEDPNCEVSLPLAKKLVAAIRAGMLKQ